MRTAWLGTGLLGLPMAEQLCESEHDVVVWNRTPDKARALVERGARLASTPQDAVQDAEVVFLMLSDAPAIESVLFQDTPVDLSERTVVQMGTIASDESRTLAERVQTEGGRYVEAPVLGSIPQARARELIVMVGAMRADFDRLHALLAVFGPEPRYVGPVGSAAALKLALNQLIASLTAAFGYSLGLVRREGLDVEMFMDILRKSALYAPTFDKKLPKMLSRDYGSPNFPTQHMLKDVRLILRQGGALGLATGALDGVAQILERAVQRGHALADYSALYEGIDAP